MRLLILFTVAAVFGSVHCDRGKEETELMQECFRPVFKECVREPVPQDRMTLCDEIKYEVDCMYEKAFDCKMPFYLDLTRVGIAIDAFCKFKELFHKNKACYVSAINNSVCVAPMDDAMRNLKTSEDFIRANKKVCNLFDTYSNCVHRHYEKNCNDKGFFKWLTEPYTRLSKSLCQELILPADEKDERPDNFGRLNVYATLAQMIASG